MREKRAENRLTATRYPEEESMRDILGSLAGGENEPKETISGRGRSTKKNEGKNSDSQPLRTVRQIAVIRYIVGPLEKSCERNGDKIRRKLGVSRGTRLARAPIILPSPIYGREFLPRSDTGLPAR